MKKIIKRFAISLLMFAFIFCFSDNTSKNVYADTADFIIDRNGVLTGYSGVGGSIVIPNGVIKIGEKAFSGCNDIVSVKFPNSITTIEKGAFDSCNNLKSVTLSNKLKTIEESAFWGCKNLKTIVIPDKVKTIEFGAFCNCDSLNSMYIPQTVSSIGDYALGFSFDGGYNAIKDFTIVSSKKSMAKSYSDKYEFRFISIESLKTSITTVQKTSNNRINIKWKKNKYVTGYQIQISSDAKFSASKTKTITVTKAKTISKAIKLTTNKKYIHIRGYRTIAGKKYYSAWSSTYKLNIGAKHN